MRSAGWPCRWSSLPRPGCQILAEPQRSQCDTAPTNPTDPPPTTLAFPESRLRAHIHSPELCPAYHREDTAPPWCPHQEQQRIVCLLELHWMKLAWQRHLDESKRTDRRQYGQFQSQSQAKTKHPLLEEIENGVLRCWPLCSAQRWLTPTKITLSTAFISRHSFSIESGLCVLFTLWNDPCRSRWSDQVS